MSRRMDLLLVCGLLFAAVGVPATATLHAQRTQPAPQSQSPRATSQPVHRGAPSSPTIALRLWIPDGTVQVRYWTRDSVDIQGTVSTGSQLVGNVAPAAGKYAVEHNDPSRPGFARAELVLTVPMGATLWVKSTTAAVHVTGGAGPLDVLTVTGEISVRQATGIVSVETIEGDVTLEALTGLVRVRGGASDVALRDVRGRTTVSLVSGAIDVNAAGAEASAIPSGRLETVSGAMRLFGTLGSGGDLELRTHDGAIQMRVPKDRVPDVTANSARTGEVTDQLRRIGRPSLAARIVIDSFKGTIAIESSGGR